jgi:hypothetical protein
MADGGSGHADTSNAGPTWPASQANLRDHAVRLRNWRWCYCLRRSCDSYDEAGSGNQPDHCFSPVFSMPMHDLDMRTPPRRGPEGGALNPSLSCGADGAWVRSNNKPCWRSFRSSDGVPLISLRLLPTGQSFPPRSLQVYPGFLSRPRGSLRRVGTDFPYRRVQEFPFFAPLFVPGSGTSMLRARSDASSNAHWRVKWSRPRIAQELRDLIRRMLWGATRPRDARRTPVIF